MTLARLELLRLVRTHRWMVLFGVYAFFGVVGPLTARYINEILTRFGGGVEFVTPDPVAVDGIAQFIANAAQLGIPAIIIVAAGALAMDAKPELSAFLRTRVPQSWRLLVPRYGVIAAASIAALIVGTAAAWAGTAVLLGGLPVRAMVAGTVLGALYVAFIIAVVAAAASVTRSMIATILLAVAAALTLPVLAVLPPLQPWLPSTLTTAVVDLAAGAPVTDHTRAAAVTLVSTPLILWFAATRLTAREL